VRPYSYPYNPYYDLAPESRRDDGDELRRGRGRAEAESMSAEPPPPAAAQSAPRSSVGGGSVDNLAEGSRGYSDRGPEKKARDSARPGLGTDYGEAVSSPTYEVEFVRANATRPSVVLGVRYNDREGLLAMGIDVDGRDLSWYREEDLRRTAEPFPADSRHFAAPPPGWRR
jgi:hypothetical protein